MPENKTDQPLEPNSKSDLKFVIVVHRTRSFAEEVVQTLGSERCMFLRLNPQLPESSQEIQREFIDDIELPLLEAFVYEGSYNTPHRKYRFLQRCHRVKHCVRNSITEYFKDVDADGILKKHLRVGTSLEPPEGPIDAILFEGSVFRKEQRQEFIKKLAKLLRSYLPLMLVAGKVDSDVQKEFLDAGVRFVLFPNFSKIDFESKVFAARAAERTAITWFKKKFIVEAGATLILLGIISLGGAFLATLGTRGGEYKKAPNEHVVYNHNIDFGKKKIDIGKKRPESPCGNRWSCDLSVGGPLCATHDTSTLSQELTLWVCNESEKQQCFSLESNFEENGLCLSGIPLRSSFNVGPRETEQVKLHIEIPKQYSEKEKTLDQVCISVKDGRHPVNPLHLPDQVKSRIRNLSKKNQETPKKNRKASKKNRVWDFLMKGIYFWQDIECLLHL